MKNIIFLLPVLITLTGFSQVTLPHIVYHDSIYLYVHPEINSTGIQWGGVGTEITFGNGAEDFYNGIQNTESIVGQLGNNGGVPYAAILCDTLNAYGYDDWYLPSYHELLNICIKKDSLGLDWHDNGQAIYLSSTEENLIFPTEFRAFSIMMLLLCDTYDSEKDQLYSCRCIRRELITSENIKNGNKNFSITYNETEKSLRILLSEKGEGINLEIFDSSGKEIVTKANIDAETKILLPNFKPGTYIVKVHGESFVKTEKFVVR